MPHTSGLPKRSLVDFANSHSNKLCIACCCWCSSDLDVVLKLRCYGRASFDSCRRELLAAVEQQLCRHAAAAAAAAGDVDGVAASADTGWQVKQCHSQHFLRLEHPQLQLQLDLQVNILMAALHSKLLFLLSMSIRQRDACY
jgi:hypothetical protein